MHVLFWNSKAIWCYSCWIIVRTSTAVATSPLWSKAMLCQVDLRTQRHIDLHHNFVCRCWSNGLTDLSFSFSVTGKRRSPKRSILVSPTIRQTIALALWTPLLCSRYLMYVSLGVPHASVFTFKKEDHTLGNLLNSRLHQNPHVTYTGYKVPHPLFRYEMWSTSIPDPMGSSNAFKASSFFVFRLTVL